MAIKENELLAYAFNLLNTDSTLKTSSGINPATGAARNVAVFNMVTPNTPVPYVRITLTDTVLVGVNDEPMDYAYVPNAKTISLLINVFSDYEPEVFSIASRIQDLLQHREITTTHFHGSSWMEGGCQYYEDNISNPDHVYRCGAIRVRVNLE